MPERKQRNQGGNRKRSDARVHRGRTQGGNRTHPDSRVEALERKQSRDTAQEAVDTPPSDPTAPA